VEDDTTVYMAGSEEDDEDELSETMGTNEPLGNARDRIKAKNSKKHDDKP
jgi:hypothetical protein